MGDHPRAPAPNPARQDGKAAVDRLLGALADPTRRAIVERLAREPLPVHRVAAAFPCTRPAISRHLRILREAGLVREERHGRERVYAIVPRALAALRAWLEEVPAGATRRPQPASPAHRAGPAAAPGTGKSAPRHGGDADRPGAEQPQESWEDWAPWARR